MLDRRLGRHDDADPRRTTGNSGHGRTTGTQNLPGRCAALLQQADQKFAEADKALKAGDLQGYATAVNQAHGLVQQALTAKK